MRQPWLGGLLTLLGFHCSWSFVAEGPLASRVGFSTSSSRTSPVFPAATRPAVTTRATGASLTMSSAPFFSRRSFLASGIAGAAAGILLLGAGGLPGAAQAVQRVGSGGPPFSKSGYDISPLTPEEVELRVDQLTELQKKVLTQGFTERPYQGKTVNGYSGNTKDEGTWVSAVSGVPLFSSSTKFESGTGWPSFWGPVDPDHVIERTDLQDSSTLPKFLWRTEVLDRKSGTHLGHVFDDGPPPTGKRYCLNAASMAFIPKEEPLPVKPSFKP